MLTNNNSPDPQPNLSWVPSPHACSSTGSPRNRASASLSSPSSSAVRAVEAAIARCRAVCAANSASLTEARSRRAVLSRVRVEDNVWLMASYGHGQNRLCWTELMLKWWFFFGIWRGHNKSNFWEWHLDSNKTMSWLSQGDDTTEVSPERLY